MKHNLAIFSFLFVFLIGLTAQKEYFKLTKTVFSSPSYDEFSPVLYKDGVVYTSNKKHDVLVTYRGTENNLPLNIYLVEKNDSVNWKKPGLFHRYFSSVLHDGPATFTADFQSMIYSRNIDAGVKFRDVINPNNKLGLFLATKVDGTWSEPSPFPYNSNDYSITTPAYDPKGQFVIFASDMPGGYGGSDLYISRKTEAGWLMPENLGDNINTHSSEAYPFISKRGDLYFSSNGYKGLGGKELLVAYKDIKGWKNPELLKEPLNSPYDDISICTDDFLEEGFISSNRDNTDDIYSFKAQYYPFENCVNQKEGQYCYLFSDDNASEQTTPFTKYQWVFSDGATIEGVEVEHCFAGPGEYSVKLNLVDEVTGNVFFTKSAFEFEIEKHVQPYIESVNVAAVGDVIKIDALKTHLPGITPRKYYWEMGNNDFETDAVLNYKYLKPGQFTIQLGVIGEDSLGLRSEYCATKEIEIYLDNQELAAKKGYVKAFKQIPSEEELDSLANHRQFNAKKDAYLFGFNFANLSAEKNHNLSKRASALNFHTISFEDTIPSADAMSLIDSLERLLREYPEVKLELAAHTDLSYELGMAFETTEKRVRAIQYLLQQKGIHRNRVVAYGYGSARQLDLFKSENTAGNNFNNRIELIFLRNNPVSTGSSLLE